MIKRLLLRAAKDVRVSFGARVKGMANISFGRSVRIARDCSINSVRGSISLGDRVTVSSFVFMDARGGSIEIGEGCSINQFCVLYGHGGLKVGKNCIIAARATFIPANHVYSGLDRPIKEQGETCRGIVIGDDCWIASGVTVLDGVNIGRGCVIGAGSVVTRDVPEYSVAVGVPARVIKSRRDAS